MLIIGNEAPYSTSEGDCPIHSHSYLSESLQRQLERDRVDKMPRDNIANTTTTESASPIVFAQKKIADYSSELTIKNKLQ